MQNILLKSRKTLLFLWKGVIMFNHVSLNTKEKRQDSVMLKSLRVKNCYSYRNEVTLDLSANKEQQEKNFLVCYPGGTDGILPVAAIYGSNAGGKTNLIRVLDDIASDTLGRIDVDVISPTIAGDASPFKAMLKRRGFTFCERPSDSVSYSICVVLVDAEYRLSYVFGESGILMEEISRRGFGKSDKETIMYTRKGTTLEDCPDENLRNYLSILSDIKEPSLWFHFVARRPESELLPLYNWFRMVRAGLTFNIAHHNPKERFQNVARDIYFSDKPSYRTWLTTWLRGLDPSVDAVHTRRTKPESLLDERESSRISDDEEHYNYEIFVYRHTDDENSIKTLPIDFESAGILKLIDLYPGVYSALEAGYPFVCDELDKQLHPETFLRLVNLFNNPETNKKRAQLIFTAHNTIVLDNDLLRHDEIHIVSKDKLGVSNIKRIAEYTDADGTPVEPYADIEQIFRNGGFGSFPEEFLNN
jgi:hypothetical protein